MAAILPVVVLLLSAVTSYAASATWISNPGDADWNNPANWTPMTVPNGPNDTATFQTSTQAGLALSANTEVNGIVFNPSTHVFTITNGPALVFTISGVGVTNNSGFAESFAISNVPNGTGSLVFSNSANAGENITYYTGGEATTSFFNSATAGNATFVNYPSAKVKFLGSSTAGNSAFMGLSGSKVTFSNSSSAGSAQFMLEAGHSGGASSGDSISFEGGSSAASSYITIGGSDSVNYQGASVGFADTSSAGNCTLIASDATNGGRGGSISFSGNSTGAMARVEIFGAASLNISGHVLPGVSVGSIEGDGSVNLGTNRLTVGANNIDTTFSGHFLNSSGVASLGKTGTGTFVLTNTNNFTDTTIDEGTLRATHDGALGTSAQSGAYIDVAANAALTLDSGTTNDYIGDRASLKIVSDSTVNLNFAGAADRLRSLIVNGISQPPGIYGGLISGAPNQLPQFAGTGRVIATTKAVSRKVQGAAGSFDVDLPLAGTPGIECRSGGANKDYQIVVTFFDNVTFSSATVISGTGFVASRSGSGTNTVTINLSNVANAQTIKTALLDVDDGTSTTTFVIPLSVLLGDVTGNGTVNATDVSQVRPGRVVDDSNFRQDVTGEWLYQQFRCFGGKITIGHGAALVVCRRNSVPDCPVAASLCKAAGHSTPDPESGKLADDERMQLLHLFPRGFGYRPHGSFP